MTDRPNRPLTINLDPGHYHYCRCGQSNSFPFCDRSHVDTPAYPKKFTIEYPQTVTLCQCGQTQHAPFCDGHHGQKKG